MKDFPGYSHWRRLLRLLLSAGVGLCVLTAVARACLDTENYTSVHFYSGAGFPDFGTPPRRMARDWIDSRDYSENRPSQPNSADYARDRSPVELSHEGDENLLAARDQERQELRNAARAAEQAGQWSKARRLYVQIGTTLGWRGSVRDRVEVLGRAARMKAPSAAFRNALRLYLDGLAAGDKQKRADAQAAFEQVSSDPAAGFLRENALYQQASLAFEAGDYPHALTLYSQLLKEFPQTRKREAALIMIARCALLPASPQEREIAVGKNALAQLRRTFPYGRFRKSRIGLEGRLYYLAGQWPQALHCYFQVGDLESARMVRKAMPRAAQGPVTVRLLAGYLRRLAWANTYGLYIRTVYDINHTREAMSAADAAAFARLLLREPDLAPSYFYYRLYHCDDSPRDLANLAHLADAFVERHPTTQLSPQVRVRLAEVYYQRRQYGKALQWADRAAQPRPFDRALYVRGAIQHKRKQYRAAITDYMALLRDFPKSSLRHGAREELAVLYETEGDYGSALQQYFALNYGADVAFLLDVRMTPAQIETVLRRQPGLHQAALTPLYPGLEKPTQLHGTQYDLLAYSLGIRYLRAEKWRQAERWLRRVPHSVYVAFSADRKRSSSNFSAFDSPSPEPLTVVHALSKLDRAVAAASSSNARAAALYAYATYYSTHGTLLLYNAALWQGGRADSFSFFWNPKQATREDVVAVRAHMVEHEVFARSRAICLEIAHRYPHSPSAPRALYRAGCACRRLASFNGWWDAEDRHHNYWDEAIHLLQQVARRYPNSPVAKHARKYARVFANEKSNPW